MVFDYGCGSGIFSLAASEIVGPDGRVFAFDKDSAALGELDGRIESRGVTNVEVVLVHPGCDVAEKVTTEADVILIYDVLHLVDDQPVLLKSLARLLKPEGILSVFPMHIEVAELVQTVFVSGPFHLREQLGMVLNFTKSGGETQE